MIILYNPQSSPNKKPILPMSVMAVGALLEGTHDYRIVDGNLVDCGLDALRKAIRESDADILGMTVMPGPQLTDALPITRALRRQFPKLNIVWGGYFPTMHPKPVLTSGCVDYVIRGHNEISFRSLAECLRSGQAPDRLPGLAGPADDPSSLVSTAPGFVPDINKLPDFPYHRVEMERYTRPTFMGTRTISHHASYGCPFRCNFCAVVNMVDGRYSAQTAERMASTVSLLSSRYGANGIEFYDNNFFVGESRIAEFAERIRPMNVGWWGYGRIDTFDKFSDRTFALLRDSGLRMVFMGAETGSNETLERMNKGGRQSTEQTIRLARRMRQFNIVPEMSFVLGNPPDPRQDVAQSLEFIRQLKAANPETEIVLYLYTPVPLAGDLYNQAFATGFRFPESLDEWATADWVDFAQHRTAGLPWLDESLKNHISDFRRVLHATYPTVTDPKLRGMRRGLLRLVGSWRYKTQFYRYPLELRALNRLMPYQRPEVSGF